MPRLITSLVYRLVEPFFRLLLRCGSFGLVAVLLGFVENLRNVARRNVRNIGEMDAERNLPGVHVRLHAVALAFADELLTERLDFG